MKVLLMSAALAFAVVSFAGEKTPNLAVEQPTYDLGIVKQGEPVTATIKFTNTGSEALEIAKVKTPCGCTSASLEQKVFQPGESGEIQVSINTTRVSQFYDKSLAIQSNDPANPETRVRLTFKVNSDDSAVAVK